VCKNTAGPSRPQVTTWCTHRYWITKGTNTHSEYVILIAFPLQQWLHEQVSCCIICTLPVLFYIVLQYGQPVVNAYILNSPPSMTIWPICHIHIPLHLRNWHLPPWYLNPSLHLGFFYSWESTKRFLKITAGSFFWWTWKTYCMPWTCLFSN